MELQNKGLENQLVNQEENLQKTELQFGQKLASYNALTRQLEAALEDGRKRVDNNLESFEFLIQINYIESFYLTSSCVCGLIKDTVCVFFSMWHTSFVNKKKQCNLLK